MKNKNVKSQFLGPQSTNFDFEATNMELLMSRNSEMILPGPENSINRSKIPNYKKKKKNQDVLSREAI